MECETDVASSLLDVSERDRDKYKALLRDSERRTEQLLEMNARLKTELEVERAATDANGGGVKGGGEGGDESTAAEEVLRGSLLDTQRRLKETERPVLRSWSEGGIHFAPRRCILAKLTVTVT